ncbi:glutamate-1-semialdehyde 2,1-aminomutase [Candidatus Epulonipiscium viviparus]|uniref:glutamate-1-semialdehyde 2,1-aminomutase n=1 Tax=Candidatus Epulonipiscium viviparus TaxID=420336 RepID=UPI0027380548|nr:glutamate-1-semialdehyde 2,1-aminomutase [Candidatus Epulopiscium viviparus]
MIHTNSEHLYYKAQKLIPGGVNSPVRAFKSVGTSPIFAAKAYGSVIEDVDGNKYIDYICSWGPLILGHSHPLLLDSITNAAKLGSSFGIPTAAEVEMAELIVSAYSSSVDEARMVNSGTEATMSALRVARGYTGRNKILKFEGCYHGHNDSLLVKSGSGTITYGVPTSLGITAAVAHDTIVAPYNDIEAVTAIFEAHSHEIAAVIVEPVSGNMGVVSATIEFLQALRDLTATHGAVLIFDEVITGFRLAYGGASEYFGIAPDMICFGKIIGGGLPVGAYAGKRAIMDVVSPVGGVYQAGTLSGNPLAMAAGITQLKYLRDTATIYADLDAKAAYLESGINTILRELNLNFTVNRVGSLLCLFFTSHKVTNYDEALTCDTQKFNIYFQSLLDQGILIGPSQFEAMFISAAHTYAQLDTTLAAIRVALNQFK